MYGEVSVFVSAAEYVTACFLGLVLDALVSTPHPALPLAAAAVWNAGRSSVRLEPHARVRTNIWTIE